MDIDPIIVSTSLEALIGKFGVYMCLVFKFNAV